MLKHGQAFQALSVPPRPEVKAAMRRKIIPPCLLIVWSRVAGHPDFILIPGTFLVGERPVSALTAIRGNSKPEGFGRVHSRGNG